MTERHFTKQAATNVQLQHHLQVDVLYSVDQGCSRGVSGGLIYVDIGEIIIIFKTVMNFIVLIHLVSLHKAV